MLEAERQAEQDIIDNCTLFFRLSFPPCPFTHLFPLTTPAVPLTDDEMREKEELETKGFESWTRRDFQQFVKGMEKHGRYELHLTFTCKFICSLFGYCLGINMD